MTCEFQKGDLYFSGCNVWYLQHSNIKNAVLKNLAVTALFTFGLHLTIGS